MPPPPPSWLTVYPPRPLPKNRKAWWREWCYARRPKKLAKLAVNCSWGQKNFDLPGDNFAALLQCQLASHEMLTKTVKAKLSNADGLTFVQMIAKMTTTKKGLRDTLSHVWKISNMTYLILDIEKMPFHDYSFCPKNGSFFFPQLTDYKIVYFECFKTKMEFIHGRFCQIFHSYYNIPIWLFKIELITKCWDV